MILSDDEYSPSSDAFKFFLSKKGIQKKTTKLYRNI